MHLVNGMLGKSLTGEEIKKLVVPTEAEPETTETIPERAANALGVSLDRIIGPGYTDDKLMTIWLDAMLQDPEKGMPTSEMALKYNLREKVMMEKLVDISDRFKREPHLKLIVKKLAREFNLELKPVMI